MKNKISNTALYLGLSTIIGTWGSEKANASFFDDEVDSIEAVTAALQCSDELSEFSEYQLSSIVGESKKGRNDVQTKSYTMSFSEGGYFGGPASKKVGDVVITVKVTPPILERPGSRQSLKWSCEVKSSEPTNPNLKSLSGQLIKKVISAGTRSEKTVAVLLVHHEAEEIKLRGKDSTNSFEISKSLLKLIDKDVTCEGVMINKGEMIQAVCEEN